jgi:hypothetical protein
MVILRAVLHLRLMLATAPPTGNTVGTTVSALAMAIILTVAVVGAVMLAIAARRTAMGSSGTSAHRRPRIDRARKSGERPIDAWSEAGRRMPVPPPERREGEQT